MTAGSGDPSTAQWVVPRSRGIILRLATVLTGWRVRARGTQEHSLRRRLGCRDDKDRSTLYRGEHVERLGGIARAPGLSPAGRSEMTNASSSVSTARRPDAVATPRGARGIARKTSRSPERDPSRACSRLEAEPRRLPQRMDRSGGPLARGTTQVKQRALRDCRALRERHAPPRRFSCCSTHPRRTRVATDDTRPMSRSALPEV